MSVQLLGESWDHNGLEMSLATHVRAHEDNTKELLNIAGGIRDKENGLKPRSQFAPLPAYVYQEFPKHVYHADGRDKAVPDVQALKAAKADGFREEPYPKVRVALGDPAAEKAALQAKLAESDGKIASQNDLIQKMFARLEALESAATEPEPQYKSKRNSS